ncbi:TPA: host cell division inhibitor Icd-like protein [Klebsiella pneumoniae]|uniref:host cell division inhibitor Icd-like protein n=3 Tax=Klebsiella/Raoultella group TaxID=2890311 RepID=UPI003D7C21DF
MSDKTKAALQSCQCHYQMFKQGQNTRVSAGGQSLSRMHICTQGIISVSFSKALKSASEQNQRVKKNITSKEQRPLFDAIFLNNFNAFHQPFLNYKICAIYGKRPNTFITIFGKVNTKGNRITLISISIVYHFKWKEIIFNNFNCLIAGNLSHCNFYSVVDFFDSLRWRRLISPLIEATTKPAVLSPSSFTFSSSPINSNGTLETICCDLLFLEPVAMSAFPFDWWHSVYAKKNHNQGLKVAFTLFYGKCMPPVKVRHKWQRPGVLGTTTEASNHNVIGANTMACIQHTQTRPKYQYRFLALNRHDKKAKPCRLSVEAATEREARSILAPHFILSLAARLPVQEVRHV